MTSEEGRIIAASNDPYKTDNPDHLAYHAANRARGRISGQMRIRVRYKRYASPWFDWLLVSKKEMESILEGTGWVVSRYIDSDTRYITIIDKTKP
jgi:dipeptidyl aminopeptidase/acylaminoacyl peptidase